MRWTLTLPRLKFVDLFAGLGGFHIALRRLGHECVFASEINDELQAVYLRNFPEMSGKVYGDIRQCVNLVPEHDILCAGFPCQPFSKSGKQDGLKDSTRGTLFSQIERVVRTRRPSYIILENVGNFEVHDSGRTWAIVRQSLRNLGYNVRGTTHVRSGGHGLISPHHLGFPHHRERFFVVASLRDLPLDPFPTISRARKTSLSEIILSRHELTETELNETRLTGSQIDCINHWNRLLKSIPERTEIQSPLWGDELWARYPYHSHSPYHAFRTTWSSGQGYRGRTPKAVVAALSRLPSYARTHQRKFPAWKVKFIRENRAWFKEMRAYLPYGWVSELKDFPPSFRKLEWNCRSGTRDLWTQILQFRPSGLRAKCYNSSPSLVAMTETQIPILGKERRFIARREGLRLQGFPDSHQLPLKRGDAFAALGNSVHIDVVAEIASRLLTHAHEPYLRVSDADQSPDQSSRLLPPHGVKRQFEVAAQLGAIVQRSRTDL